MPENVSFDHITEVLLQNKNLQNHHSGIVRFVQTQSVLNLAKSINVS